MKNKLISLALAMFAAISVEAKTSQHQSIPITGTIAPNTTNVFVGTAAEVVTFGTGTNVNSGDSITIGFGQVGRATYTFTNATGTNIPIYGVLVGTNAANSITNLLQAIAGGNTGNGTNYGTNTPANTLVTVAQTTSNSITLTSVVPGFPGNTVTVSASQTSGDILFPYNYTGLYGGFDNALFFIPWNTGIGVSITQQVTNSTTTSNVTYSLSFSAVKKNLYLSQASSSGYSFSVPLPASTSGEAYYTNAPIATCENANYVGINSLGNADKTNNVTYSIVFSWTEDDGK